MGKRRSKRPVGPPDRSEAELEFQRLYEGAADPGPRSTAPQASALEASASTAPAGDAPDVTPGSASQELQRENRRLRQQIIEKEREAERLYGLWKQQEGQLKERQGELEALGSGLEKAEQRAARVRDQARLDREEAQADLRSLRDQLAALSSRSLGELLEAAELCGTAETMQLISCLQADPEGRTLMGMWVISEPVLLESWIAKRLLRWCGASDCLTDHPTERRIEVTEASRCQLCRGSKRRRLANRLLLLCEQQGIRRVIVAGGSPNYRDQLQKLLGERLSLNVVLDQDGHAGRQRANATASADLVVVWGATETSHSFTDSVIAAASERPIRLRSRGLESMLEELISQLSQG